MNFSNKEFLEFYGILLGDGWICQFKCQHHRSYYYNWIGVTGNLHENDYLLLHVKRIMEKLSRNKVTVKYRIKDNALELISNNKSLAIILNKELSFPIGKKNKLSVPKKILNDWRKLKYVLRGLFDTDGTLYFDKARGYRRPYPVVEFNLNAPILIKQIAKQLKNRGYSVISSRNRSRIRLKGFRQCTRWFKEIKPMNKKHTDKYEKFVAPVAQPG